MKSVTVNIADIKIVILCLLFVMIMTTAGAIDFVDFKDGEIKS